MLLELSWKQLSMCNGRLDFNGTRPLTFGSIESVDTARVLDRAKEGVFFARTRHDAN